MTGTTASNNGVSRQLSSTSVASVNLTKEDLIRSKGMEFAKKNVTATFAKSDLQDRTAEFPKFDLNEVQLGKVLGKGGFGTVSEVRAFDVTADQAKLKKKQQLRGSITKSKSILHRTGPSMRNLMPTQSRPHGNGDKDEQVEAGQMESRKFISDHCIRHGGDARYALKILSPEVVQDTGKFIQGVIDMAVETRFLSDIEHPNIVKLRATAQCEPYHANYFIVMDRLYDTLEKRLQCWTKRAKRAKGFGCFGGGQAKEEALYEERIVAAFDLASAVQYLHSRGILYRDLKPENVGFDIRDDIKIFDFGLSKEITHLDRDDNGTYKLTGMTGSPRYMAPEVGLEKRYNATCDSYSFAIMLWEMMALRTPFELYTMKSLKAKVWEGGKRPAVDETWPVAVKLLLKRSWDEDLTIRNDMTQISVILRKECSRCRGGDETGLEHTRRRSTFVFRPTTTSGVKNKRSLVTAQ